MITEIYSYIKDIPYFTVYYSARYWKILKALPGKIWNYLLDLGKSLEGWDMQLQDIIDNTVLLFFKIRDTIMMMIDKGMWILSEFAELIRMLLSGFKGFGGR